MRRSIILQYKPPSHIERPRGKISHVGQVNDASDLTHIGNLKNTPRHRLKIFRVQRTTKDISEIENARGFGPMLGPIGGHLYNQEAFRQPWRRDLPDGQYDFIQEYTPEPSKTVKVLPLGRKSADGKQFCVNVKVGDISEASESSVCGYCTGDLSPVGVACQVLYDKHAMADNLLHHNKSLGEIPMSCVGVTEPAAGGFSHLIHTALPVWKGGLYHEARWLSTTISNIIDECLFNSVPSVALHGTLSNWPAEESHSVILESLIDFADCTFPHSPALTEVSLYFDKEDDAIKFVDLAAA